MTSVAYPAPKWTGTPSDERLTELQAQVAELVREHVIPIETEIDSMHRIPSELWRRLAAPPHQLIGAVIPREYGGRGASLVECCVIMEELAYSSFSVATCTETTTIVPTYLLASGSEAVNAEFLPAIAAFDRWVGFAVTDMNAGTDAADMLTSFEEVDGGYLISGRKRLVSLADQASAYILIAKHASDPRRGNLTAFLVDADTPGVRLAQEEFCFGMRGHTTWQVEFEDVHVPGERRLGELGHAMEYLLATLDRTRGSYACGALGVARRALDIATDFATDQIIMGKRLIDNQAIHFPLIELMGRVESTRMLAYRASAAADGGSPSRVETSMAKLLASKLAIESASFAVNVLGGYGTQDIGVAERLVRDAHTLQFGQGSPNAQSIAIARDLFGSRP